MLIRSRQCEIAFTHLNKTAEVLKKNKTSNEKKLELGVAGMPINTKIKRPKKAVY